jgi:predicted nucleotidyltransferase
MPTDEFREVLRVTRGNETRIYRLVVGSGNTELWRLIEAPGQPDRSIKECDLANADEAWTFLEEVKRTLKAGGWREG